MPDEKMNRVIWNSIKNDLDYLLRDWQNSDIETIADSIREEINWMKDDEPEYDISAWSSKDSEQVIKDFISLIPNDKLMEFYAKTRIMGIDDVFVSPKENEKEIDQEVQKQINNIVDKINGLENNNEKIKILSNYIECKDIFANILSRISDSNDEIKLDIFKRIRSHRDAKYIFEVCKTREAKQSILEKCRSTQEMFGLAENAEDELKVEILKRTELIEWENGYKIENESYIKEFCAKSGDIVKLFALQKFSKIYGKDELIEIGRKSTNDLLKLETLELLDGIVYEPEDKNKMLDIAFSIENISDILKSIIQKNENIAQTVNYKFLNNEELVSKFSFEQLLRITNDSDIQNKLLNEFNKGNIIYIDVIKYILDNTDNDWTINADKIFYSYDNMYFKELFENFSSVKVEEDIMPALITVLLKENNYFEIESKEDLENYFDENGKRGKILRGILNGEINYIDGVEKQDLDKFAICEYLYGIDLNFAREIIEKFGMGTLNIEQVKDEETKEKLLSIKEYIKDLIDLENGTEEYVTKIKQNILENKEQIRKFEKYPNSMEIISDLLNIYGKVFEEKAYIPQESELEKHEVYIDKNGNENDIAIYRVKDNFNMLVRVEGAYNKGGRTNVEDFAKYFDSPQIDYHGNCESIIGQDSISPARNDGLGIIVGYSEIPKNSFLLMGPYDLNSNKANKTLAPINYQKNAKFMTPQETIDNTRHTHNEIVMERLVIDENGNVQKLKPNYVIWIEEELGEKIPSNDDINEKSDPEELIRSIKWKQTKQAAAQLGVPIVVINREYYAQKEQAKIDEMKQIIEGKKEDNEKRDISELIKDSITKFENNRTGLRLAIKINGKYFTDEKRLELIEVINKKIDELIKINPEEAKKCLEELQKVYDREAKNQEIDKKFYEVKAEENKHKLDVVLQSIKIEVQNVQKNENQNNYISRKNGSKITEKEDNNVRKKAASEVSKSKSRDIINYYEVYGFNKGDNWDKVKSILGEEAKKWMKRQSTANNQKYLEEINEKLAEIDKALQIFNPQNAQERLEYDAALKVSNQEKKMKIKIVSLENISNVIRKNPVSLTHYKYIQNQLAESVNNMQMKQNNEVIDYYEKYGINQNEDVKAARRKILRTLGEWEKNAANIALKGPNKTIEEEIYMAQQALKIFNPKQPERLEEYKKKLNQSKTANKEIETYR